jgi:hypothetical protein
MNHTGLALIRKDENVTSELEAALSAAKEAGEVLRKGFGLQKHGKEHGDRPTRPQRHRKDLTLSE